MKGGVDQGFCLSYWHLSYRRKFIRTLWNWPFAVALLVAAIALDWRPIGLEYPWDHIALLVFVSIGSIVQAVYTRRKWRQEQASDGDR